jgi:hypothetical protein
MPSKQNTQSLAIAGQGGSDYLVLIRLVTREFWLRHAFPRGAPLWQRR